MVVWRCIHALLGINLLVLLSSFTAVDSFGFRLCSWNLLAQKYISARKFPWCDPSHLEWEHRKQLIGEQVLGTKADVLCLQEVQVDLWPELSLLLEEFGYGRSVLQSTSRHPVATAVFLKDTFPMNVRRVESRSRALIVVLEHEHEQGNMQPLYLCSVHLEAGMSENNDETRYRQVSSLWKHLARQCKKDGAEPKDASIIIAGDFNMLRSNAIYESLKSGILETPDSITKQRKKGSVSLPKRVPPLLDVFNDPSLTTSAYEDTTSEFSNHLCKTFLSGCVIDYIWITESIDLMQSLVLHPNSATYDRQPTPSAAFPSDHLPIGVDVNLQQ